MLAWLGKKPKKSNLTNGELYPDLERPQVDDEVLYLTDFIEEIGIVINNGMGVSALTFTEIQAWSDLTAIEVTPQEAKMMRMMSAAYAGQVNSTDEDCPIDDDRVRESIDLVNIKAMIAMAQSS